MMKTVYHTLSWLKFVACEVDETFVKRGYDYAKQEFERLSVKDYKKMGYRQQNKTDSLLVIMEMYARGITLSHIDGNYSSNSI